MKVFVDKTGKELELEFSGTVQQLLERLKINPETVIVARNEGLVTLSDKVAGDDNIKVLSVLSGG